MMLEILETGKALYALAAVCVLGLLSRLMARNLYKGLIRETDNMTMTKNRYLRDLRQKAENTYRLNQGIQNTPKNRLLNQCMLLTVEANRRGINFSDQETDLLTDILVNYMNPADRGRLDLFRMMSKKLASRHG